jgi:hypothetical protein
MRLGVDDLRLGGLCQRQRANTRSRGGERIKIKLVSN